ncbi:MAG: hypothetical protein MJB14_09545 [Spirochaetes bacterium]|nr:hypothetical protein [Spirochaetota bacterium]
MKIKYIFSIVFIILVFIQCKKKEQSEEVKKRFDGIYHLTDNYQFKEALEQINNFEKEYPGYKKDQLTIPLLKLVCYTAINDFENSKKYFEICKKNWEPGVFNDLLNISIDEMFLGRIYLKYLNFNDAFKNSKKLLHLITNVKDEYHAGFNFNSVTRVFYLNDLVLNILLFSKGNIQEKRYQDRIDILFDFIIKLHNSTNSEYKTILITFAELIDFQTVEGEYHTDMIWSDEVFIEYFKKLKAEKLINKKTLSDLKEMVYRDTVPNDLAKLFENHF